MCINTNVKINPIRIAIFVSGLATVLNKAVNRGDCIAGRSCAADRNSFIIVLSIFIFIPLICDTRDVIAFNFYLKRDRIARILNIDISAVDSVSIKMIVLQYMEYQLTTKVFCRHYTFIGSDGLIPAYLKTVTSFSGKRFIFKIPLILDVFIRFSVYIKIPC